MTWIGSKRLTRSSSSVFLSSSVWVKNRVLLLWTPKAIIFGIQQSHSMIFPWNPDIGTKWSPWNPWNIWVCYWKCSVTHCTQWFCWSLSLLNCYFIGGINPTFSDIPIWMIGSWTQDEPIPSHQEQFRAPRRAEELGAVGGFRGKFLGEFEDWRNRNLGFDASRCLKYMYPLVN